MTYLRKEEQSQAGFIEPFLSMEESNIVTDREFVKSLPIKDDYKVLDVGCGLKRDLAYLQKTYPGVSLTGLDLKKYDLDSCPEATLVIADATKTLPFPDNSFDLAYANSIFTEMTEAEVAQVLSEMKRVATKVYYVEVISGKGGSFSFERKEA